MIIIADAHVDENRASHLPFFQMLEAIAATRDDVVFLGDIFELWIGFSRYESSIHERFMTWCRAEKRNRTVGFLEGNHEYFVATDRSDCFSWCTATSVWRDEHDVLYCHGDKINSRDRNYLRFRKLVKNRLVRIVLKKLPYGPAVAAGLKRDLKKTNLQFRKHLPRTEIERFAERVFADGVQTVWVGHFHRHFQYKGKHGGSLRILPAWMDRGQIARIDPETGDIAIDTWNRLVPVRGEIR